MLGIHTILSPVDFSECSQSAFQIAQALARDYHARLIVLHVAVPPPFVTPGELERVLHRRHGYAEELKEKLRQTYTPLGSVNAEYQMEDGDPATEILGVAHEVQCDLIVIGTHGRSGLGRVLLGSVAEQVVRKADCPVLTVKIPELQR